MSFPPGLIQPFNQVHQIDGNGTGTQNNDNIAESRHNNYLHETFVLSAFYIEQEFLSIENRTKIRKNFKGVDRAMVLY